MGNTQAAAKEPTTARMPSAGVYVETLQAGNGVTPQRGERVGIVYEGMNAEGQRVGGKGYFPVGMGHVDKCLDQSVGTMTAGETARVICAPEAFYAPLAEVYARQNIPQQVQDYSVTLVRVKACNNVDGC